MTTINVEAVRNALLGVESAVRAFETYEMPLYPDQLEKARSAVLILKTAVQAVAALKDQQGSYRLPLLPPAFIPPIDYVLKNADEIRLELAAYAPHSESRATQRLRQRQKIAKHLKELVQEGRAILAAQSGSGGAPQPQPRRETRPAYLRLVSPGEATHEGQPESREGSTEL